MSFGSQSPTAPVLALFGGVHGLERIGSQVVLSLMRSFGERLLWDASLKETLTHIRILYFPMINPIGIYKRKRANPNGVDLMRNAPIEADSKPAPLLGGHRIGNWLPWYRGEQLEPENQAVIRFCQEQMFNSTAIVAVDFHSGFGSSDQLWLPYAGSKAPFPNLAEAHALLSSFERTYPHHFYKIEPQSLNYTTHGDLWDYIYKLYREQNPNGTLLPLTLEMGSWLWIRKNPVQFFSALGPFNPIKPHRRKRILRRHMTLFDFLIRAVRSPQFWTALTPEQKEKQQNLAQNRWYS